MNMIEGTTNSNGDNKINNGVEYVDSEEIQKYWDKESIKFCAGMYFVKGDKERSDKSSESSNTLGTGFVEVDLQEIIKVTYEQIRPEIFKDPVKQTSLKGKDRGESQRNVSQKTSKTLEEDEK